jgi:hypothetical protein
MQPFKPLLNEEKADNQNNNALLTKTSNSYFQRPEIIYFYLPNTIYGRLLYWIEPVISYLIDDLQGDQIGRIFAYWAIVY